MSINLEQEQYLNAIKDQVDVNDRPLSEWEKNFWADQMERYDIYGSGTRFSPKQWNIVMKIGDLFDLERVGLD